MAARPPGRDAVTPNARRRIFAIVVVAALSACLPFASARLGLSNGTDLDLTFMVNGQRLGVVPPQTVGEGIPFDALPAAPWTVEIMSPSGRVVTWTEVDEGGARQISAERSSDHVRVLEHLDLSCGRVLIWAGLVAPPGPAPAEDDGVPGDCEP